MNKKEVIKLYKKLGFTFLGEKKDGTFQFKKVDKDLTFNCDVKIPLDTH